MNKEEADGLTVLAAIVFVLFFISNLGGADTADYYLLMGLLLIYAIFSRKKAQ